MAGCFRLSASGRAHTHSDCPPHISPFTLSSSLPLPSLPSGCIGMDGGPLLLSLSFSSHITTFTHSLLHSCPSPQVALDWMESPSGSMTEETPIIVCLHGMGGHSHSRYLQVWMMWVGGEGGMHGMEVRSHSHPMPPHIIRCHLSSTTHHYSYYSPPAPLLSSSPKPPSSAVTAASCTTGGGTAVHRCCPCRHRRAATRRRRMPLRWRQQQPGSWGQR